MSNGDGLPVALTETSSAVCAGSLCPWFVQALLCHFLQMNTERILGGMTKLPPRTMSNHQAAPQGQWGGAGRFLVQSGYFSAAPHYLPSSRQHRCPCMGALAKGKAPRKHKVIGQLGKTTGQNPWVLVGWQQSTVADSSFAS